MASQGEETIREEKENATETKFLGESDDFKTVAEIKRAISSLSAQYGLCEKEFYETVKCESHFHFDAYNPKDKKVGGSFGVAQFIPSTFKENCKGEYKSAKSQLTCMAEMFKKGMKERWTCWRKLFKNKKIDSCLL